MYLFAWLRGWGVRGGGEDGKKESYLSLFPTRPLATSRAVAKVVSLCGLQGMARGKSRYLTNWLNRFHSSVLGLYQHPLLYTVTDLTCPVSV